MRREKRGLSLGSVLTIVLTLCVISGSVVFFSAMQSGESTVMSAKRMAGLISEAMGRDKPEVTPQATVRTVTVTLAPPVPTAAPEPENRHYSVTMTVGGLLAFQSEISDSVYDKSAQVCDYASVLSELQPYFCSDINTAVFPHVLNAAGKKYTDASIQASAANALRSCGINTVLLHPGTILEAGLQPALDSADVLSRAGLDCFGINAGNAQQNALIEKNGMKIAILSFTEAVSTKVQNTLVSNGNLMKLYSDAAAHDAISSARSHGADCVIVWMHWNNQNAKEISSGQRAVAQKLTAYGADLILGTGSSRVLPVEKVTAPGEKGNNRQAIAAYSLGTLLTESREGYDISGMLLHFTLNSDGNGKSFITNLCYTPTYIWRQSVNGKNQYRIVNSNAAPPEQMNQNQKEVMSRALERVKSTLGESDLIRLR